LGVFACAEERLLLTLPHSGVLIHFSSMRFEIILTGIALVLGCGEFVIWYSEVLWHKEDKKNSGNWTPPR
jgi:hypothetical protein